MLISKVYLFHMQQKKVGSISECSSFEYRLINDFQTFVAKGDLYVGDNLQKGVSLFHPPTGKALESRKPDLKLEVDSKLLAKVYPLSQHRQGFVKGLVKLSKVDFLWDIPYDGVVCEKRGRLFDVEVIKTKRSTRLVFTWKDGAVCARET